MAAVKRQQGLVFSAVCFDLGRQRHSDVAAFRSGVPQRHSEDSVPQQRSGAAFLAREIKGGPGLWADWATGEEDAGDDAVCG